jgi:hypothetical protein
MKRIIYSLSGFIALASLAFAVPANVQTDSAGGALTNSFSTGTKTITVSTGGTLNVSAGTLTLADGQIAQIKVNGLASALDAKAPLASPTFTGTVTSTGDLVVQGSTSLDNGNISTDGFGLILSKALEVEFAVQLGTGGTHSFDIGSGEEVTYGFDTTSGTLKAIAVVADLSGSTGFPVTSVNTQTGDVVLTAADVGALDQTAADALYQPLENQRLSTGNSPTFIKVNAPAISLSSSDDSASMDASGSGPTTAWRSNGGLIAATFFQNDTSTFIVDENGNATAASFTGPLTGNASTATTASYLSGVSGDTLTNPIAGTFDLNGATLSTSGDVSANAINAGSGGLNGIHYTVTGASIFNVDGIDYYPHVTAGVLTFTSTP